MGKRNTAANAAPAAIRVNPMRKTKKNKKHIEIFKKSTASDMCQQWLKQQKKLKKEIDKPTTKDDELLTLTEDNIENPNCTIKLPENRKRFCWSKHKNHVDAQCEWKKCMKEFSDGIDFSEHVVEHAFEVIPNEGLYECLWDLCGFVGTDASALTRHLSFHAYHTQLKAYGESYRIAINIPLCAYDSRNRNYFVDADEDYVCQWRDCSKKFNSIVVFFEHVSSEHCFSLYREKEMTCKWDVCSKTCATPGLLKEHVHSHTMERIVACPHCGIMFKSTTSYFDHCSRQQINNTHEFQCTQCFKYFASERLLRSHMRMHVNCIKCTLCDMSCAYPSDLVRHIRHKHLNERPFACQHCSYQCVMKKDLATHMATHFNETYECQDLECTFTSKSKYILKKHYMTTHGAGLNVYACHCCDITYTKSQLLSRHLKNKHNFRLPSGHYRFRYKQCDDGLFRLQTTRIESLEVTKQIISNPNDSGDEDEDDEEEKQSNGFSNQDASSMDLAELKTEIEIFENRFADFDDQNCFANVNDHNDEQSEVLVNENTLSSQREDISSSAEEPIKNIDNFKIMKYLRNKPEKSISIDIKDVDENGRIVKTTALSASEIVL